MLQPARILRRAATAASSALGGAGVGTGAGAVAAAAGAAQSSSSSSSSPSPGAGSAPLRPSAAARFPASLKQSAVTLEEALYLAREAGYYTTQEEQLLIVKSPPFSPRENPFLLENFFDVPDAAGGANMTDAAGGANMKENDLEKGDKDGEDRARPEAPETVAETADATIHGTIQKYFRRDLPPKFFHNGEEWLSRAEGRGTRKRASAHAVIVRGSGLFKVNGESDMFAWWPLFYHRFDVCQPFQLTGTAGAYDVFVQVQGGGNGGQAGATRLAVARALLQANPSCHDNLQRGYCLFEDTRQKMSKMPGKASARGAFPWTKR